MVQEGLTAIRAVKAFVRDEYEEEKFAEVNTDLTSSSEKTFHYAVLNLPAFQAVDVQCHCNDYVVWRKHDFEI